MQSFPIPRTASEAPLQPAYGGYPVPLIHAVSHAVQYPPMPQTLGSWAPPNNSFNPVGMQAPSLVGPSLPATGGPTLVNSGSFSGTSQFAPPPLAERLVGDTVPPNPNFLLKCASQAPIPNFQFKFEPGPISSGDLISSGGLGNQNSNRMQPVPPSPKSQVGPGSLAEKLPAQGNTLTMAATAPPTTAPPVVAPPTPMPTAERGREGVLQRLKSPPFGVSQESMGCTMQLDECVARCRREVQEIAAGCKVRGQKYSDPNFPTGPQSLYTDGQGASLALGSARPKSWLRASEGAFVGVTPSANQTMGSSTLLAGSIGSTAEVLIPGPFGGVGLLGALATMRTAGKEPRELIVWREPEAGVYGVRLFKDGEWMFEILDDNLPMDENGRPACSFAMGQTDARDWVALIEKAYAKVHGSYEAAALGTEAEALEDVLGMGANRIEANDFPIWGELWQHFKSRKHRGFVQLAVRRVEQPGEVLTNGLISGYGYPLTKLEIIGGEMLCELQNPWSRGTWTGRWGEGSNELLCRPNCQQLDPTPDSIRPFWMSIQDFCKHFTDIVEARVVPACWQSAAVTCSTDRPSYPLISVPSATQALFVLTQGDRRWTQNMEYKNAIGLRIYRCRIMAPAQNVVGARQNVSSPFRNLELLAERPLTKAHTVVLEVARLEPDCLYIATVDSETRCSYAVLRVFTLVGTRFRQLSAPESSYFLQAQSAAVAVTDTDSFSSQGSLGNDNGTNQYQSAPVNSARDDPMRRVGIEHDAAEGWREWPIEDGDAIKIPPFLQACIGTCSGDC